MNGFGVLHLFKNRELAFTAADEPQQSFGSLTAEELLRSRNKEREDLSFIDNASSILSRGGGLAYSMKSSTLDALSMMTPPTTNPSAKSSIFGSRISGQSTNIDSKKTKSVMHELKPLKKDLIWNRYKLKNAEALKKRDEMRQSQHEKWKSGVVGGP